MKKINFLAIVMVVCVFSSCGGQKSVASNQTSYQTQYSQQQQQPQPNVSPTVSYGEDVREEKIDPWFEAQAQATNKLRGAASFTSTNKAIALRTAQTLATENLASQIEQAVSSATRLVLSEMGLNQEHVATSQYAADIRTKIENQVNINYPINTWTRTLKNGNYEMGYCFEMQMTKVELAAYLAGEMIKELQEEYQEIKTLDDNNIEKVKKLTKDAQDFLYNTL